MSEQSSGNGRAPLTKEALADRTRFQFKTEELDLTDEIRGVVLTLKTLSVAERDGLPDLTKPNPAGGEPVADVTIPKLAAVFATVVSSPKVTQEEAEAFLGDWPATALDKVIEKFGELTGTTREEQRAAAGSFPADQ